MPVLQGPVPGLVLGEYVLALAQLLPQVSYLLAEGRVLLLQERRPDGDLILLQPPGIAGALGCHVVLSAPGPVLVILQIIRDEDFASFLNHGLRLQFFLRELAFARVKHFLTRDAGEGKVCRVWLITHRDLDGVRINGTRCIAVCWQQLTFTISLILKHFPDT